MFKILVLLLASCLMACGNKVEVPENVNTQVQVQPVTGEIIVKHVLSIELPTVFTDSCRTQFPADEVAYQKCVTDYINQIIKIIGGINPSQLPTTVPSTFPVIQ
jgi:hypothetical protein